MKDTGLFLAVLMAGFGVGFLWGARTREALPDVTSTSYSGGIVTVRVDAGAALKQGLTSAFGG